MNDSLSPSRLDYSTLNVRTTDHKCADAGPSGSVDALTDGLGAERFPAAWRVWTRGDAPAPGKPAVVVIDYGEPIEVTCLAHYFYVPGSRDHRWRDYLCGPAAFGEVRIYTGDDDSDWTQVAHLTDLHPQCPQLLSIAEPRAARRLKLEVISMAPGAPGIRSYELETWTGGCPDVASIPEGHRVVRRGFPSEEALAPAPDANGPVQPSDVEIRIDDAAVSLKPATNSAEGVFTTKAVDYPLKIEMRQVRAGLLVECSWHGPVSAPFGKLVVAARVPEVPQEWCIPGYHYSRSQPETVSVASAVIGTCAAIVSDGENAVAIIPDTDASWVGLDKGCVTTSFPMDGETARALIVTSRGRWHSAFRKAVVEVFSFDEPRQFSPASQAVPELCKFVLRPELWSEKYHMLRSFPDTDFFYIFYSLPFAIPALTMWGTMSGDESINDKVDCILRFTLDRRIPQGPMAGALFSEYADRELVENKQVPFGYSPFYEWHVNYPDERLVGMDQGCSRWITAHNMGAVLWAITYVWQSRGGLPPDVLTGARDVADWMVRMQKGDGSWSYAYNEDGATASPMSDSGTIWNVWSLWRFGRMTGESKYTQAAERAMAYFKSTFTANHLYRGYWEDIYGGGKTELNSAQGYESAIAAIAFAEMGDSRTAVSSAQDAMRFVCTRVLESRDYWTSYGGVAEQQNWAPGTYIAPTFGYAAHIAWRISGDDFFKPFASIAKTIGWWQDPSGGAFWMSAAVSQQPIEMLREDTSDRQFWALWDSAQKAAFTIPWLVEEANRRTGDRMAIDVKSLRGTDDLCRNVRVSMFDGQVDSASGQVNWLALASGDAGNQLVLMNHAEATDCIVRPSSGALVAAARAFDENGRRVQAQIAEQPDGVTVRLPERHTAILVWSGD